MTTTQRGKRTEALFIITALERDWELATPFCEDNGYDFIIRREKMGQWEAVQVKTAYHGGRDKRNFLEVGFRRSKGKFSGVQPYNKGDFDLLFAASGKDRWIIPWDIVKDQKSYVLVGHPKYDEYRI
jgi:hypothetical protein